MSDDETDGVSTSGLPDAPVLGARLADVGLPGAIRTALKQGWLGARLRSGFGAHHTWPGGSYGPVEARTGGWYSPLRVRSAGLGEVP
jgi:hypothetical protein